MKFWSLVFTFFFSLCSMATQKVSFVSTTGLTSDSNQKIEPREGVGLSLTTKLNQSFDFRTEFLNSEWSSDGSYMEFSNRELNLSGLIFKNLPQSKFINIYFGGGLGVSQYSTTIHFQSQSKEARSLLEPVFKAMSGAELSFGRFSGALEGGLYWADNYSPNSLVVLSLNLGVRF